jgi:hypothetical protein
MKFIANFFIDDRYWLSHILIFSLVMNFSLNVEAQSSGLIADGANLKLVSDQFAFTEGPATDKKRKCVFYRPAK